MNEAFRLLFDMVRAIRPHIVLLDVMMPGLLDGCQVCARIKQAPELKQTQVVMLTARGQVTDLAAGEAAGLLTVGMASAVWWGGTRQMATWVAVVAGVIFTPGSLHG